MGLLEELQPFFIWSFSIELTLQIAQNVVLHHGDSGGVDQIDDGRDWVGHLCTYALGSDLMRSVSKILSLTLWILAEKSLAETLSLPES